MEAKTVQSIGNVTPEMAEIMAIKEALSWIVNHDWPDVVLESDCSLAVQAIRAYERIFFFNSVSLGILTKIVIIRVFSQYLHQMNIVKLNLVYFLHQIDVLHIFYYVALFVNKKNLFLLYSIFYPIIFK